MWRGGAARRTLERIMRRQNLSYGTPQALPFYTRRLIPHHHSHWYAKSILCCIRTQLCLKQAWSSLKVLTNGNGSPGMPSIHMKTATNVRPWYTQNGLLLGGYDKRAISKTTLPTTPELFIGLIQAIWQKISKFGWKKPPGLFKKPNRAIWGYFGLRWHWEKKRQLNIMTLTQLFSI